MIKLHLIVVSFNVHLVCMLEFVCPTRANRKTTRHDQCLRYPIHITSDLPLGFHCVLKKKSSRSDKTRFPQWQKVACINDLRMQSDQLITATSRYRRKVRVKNKVTKIESNLQRFN